MAQVGNIFGHTGRVVVFGDGVGQNRSLALLCPLTFSELYSSLTFARHPKSAENQHFRKPEFFNTICALPPLELTAAKVRNQPILWKNTVLLAQKIRD
ncbi:hypothetical protein GP644_21500 [Parasedimentitalea maritima]|uniref:Uncharacterized protein n=1 Tax=Parasedimentitalea maritima TaxID=2578117 RepID=A0A6A4R782_9RHOB|nr:hypothetical protein GP644_21500 [Zongyanglinia marina]